MGIQNLLKFFFDAFTSSKLSTLSGKTVGVDAYVWLHKSVYCKNMELAINPNSTAYVSFFFSLIYKFLKHNVKLVIVFDGAKNPLKLKEENAREFKRNAKKETAISFLKTGNFTKFKSLYTSSIDITPKMTLEIIKKLKEIEVEYIIAPYESDAELAYLASINYIDYVCTEDSDLIAYGCPRIIYKFDYRKESFQLFESSAIFKKFLSYEQFLEFCVLAGCDYFKAEGISIHKAYAIIKKFNTFQACVFRNKDIYVTAFENAKNMFLHQVVYCPLTKKCRYLTSIQDYIEVPELFGSLIPDDVIESIQKGETDPTTLKPFNFN